MTFYQELQLSSAGSKQLIHKTTTSKEKRRHILIYNFKVYLVMAFCVAVVSLFSKFLEPENSCRRCYGTSGYSGTPAGRFRDSNHTWTWCYRPPLCYSHDRTASRKYASATSRISCASCLHPVTNDFWMPQCYYV